MPVNLEQVHACNRLAPRPRVEHTITALQITLLASTFDTFDTQSTSHNECAPLLQRTPPQTRLDSIPCSPKRDVSSGRSISFNRWVTTDNHFKGKPHRMEDRPTGIHQRPGSDRFLPMRFYRQHINSRPTSATYRVPEA